ncbi:MAG: BON domain-containing protein [Thiogranum sp.]|nr:BON domain-containing protein [Thiogranum sp.]
MTKRWLALGILLNTTLLLSACAPVMFGGVATTASVAHDRRTTGSVIEDQAIELRVGKALRDAGIHRQAHVNITSYNGIVLLSGEAPTEELRSRIGEFARRDEKARRVHNEIVLAAPSSFMTRSSDALLTTRVKAALLSVRVDGFDATRVKVVSENGTVFLMGLLHHAEAAAVTGEAQSIGGVQRIVKLFEYLD